MKTAFRLIRRTLLCLFVGVTAFGVSGWLLRPRADWSVETPGAYRLIVGSGHELFEDDPIWIEGDGIGAVAYRATDGRLLQTIPPPDANSTVANYHAVPGGRLVVAPTSDPSRLFVYETTTKTPIASATLDGDWTICADWRHAWRLQRQNRVWRFECRDAWTGKEVTLRLFIDEFGTNAEMIADYSSDSGLLAVSERMRPGRSPPFGVELIDVKTGAVLKTVGRDAPENEGSGPRWLCFLHGGRHLKYELVGAAPFQVVPGCIDVTTGRASSFDRSALPVKGGGAADVSMIAEADGRMAWTLNSSAPSSAWFSLSQSNEPHWRQVPGMPIVEEQFMRRWPGSRVVGAYARPVPLRPAVVVRVNEKSLSNNLPESFAGFIPSTMLTRDRTTRHWWHDWPSNTWRRVGDSGTLLDERPWPNALITLSQNPGGNPMLQSWPLPPRDPKPPAAVIGIVSAALVWWFCARRYARRRVQVNCLK